MLKKTIALYTFKQAQENPVLHSVSDYKKHLNKKRLVDLILSEKRTLVYFYSNKNIFIEVRRNSFLFTNVKYKGKVFLTLTISNI